MFYHFHLQNIIQKVYLLLENFDQLKSFKYCFCSYIVGSDWYLFQLFVLLKPYFDCCNSFASSYVEKVTTGTSSVVLVIANVPAPVELVITQVDIFVLFISPLQLINGAQFLNITPLFLSS